MQEYTAGDFDSEMPDHYAKSRLLGLITEEVVHSENH
jgi:hypothetical protein